MTILTTCRCGHEQRFALSGCGRSWADRMAELLESHGCNRCGAKITVEVQEHGARVE